MQPEDVGVSPGEGRIPDSLVGRRVEAVRPVNPDQPAYSTSLTALTLLEEVDDRGIVASLASGAEMLVTGTFYPWGAVLSLRLAEER